MLGCSSSGSRPGALGWAAWRVVANGFAKKIARSVKNAPKPSSTAVA